MNYTNPLYIWIISRRIFIIGLGKKNGNPKKKFGEVKKGASGLGFK